MFQNYEKTSRAHLLGALASSLAATCFVIGFVVYFASFADSGYPSISDSNGEQVRFMLNHFALLQTWYAIVYLLFGACLVVIVTVLQSRVVSTGDLLASIANIFGLIWSALMFFSGLLINVGLNQISEVHAYSEEQAITLWMVIYALLDSLGGRNELVGGAWLLLLNVSSFKQASLPTWLSFTGMSVGAAGISTCIPGLEIAGFLFGMGAIAWFIGLSVVLPRHNVHSRQRG